jgi:hypothetical protein
MKRLHGTEAIEHARAHDLTLSKYADPIEGWRDGLTPAEAEAVSEEDPGLVYIDVAEEEEESRSPLVAEMRSGAWTVSDPNGGVWVPTEEAQAEITAAHDPETAAVMMCTESPMQGVWHA